MFARKTSPFVPHILRKCLSAIGFAPFRHVFAPFRHGGKVQNLWRNVPMAQTVKFGLRGERVPRAAKLPCFSVRALWQFLVKSALILYRF